MLSNTSEVDLLSQFTGFLQTPDIRNNYGSEIPVFEFPEVDITKELIAELEKIDHPRNSVLGKRMESFFEIAIKFSNSLLIFLILEKSSNKDVDNLTFLQMFI